MPRSLTGLEAEVLWTQSHEGWLRVDWPSGLVCAGNPKVGELCGTSVEETLGCPFWNLFEPESVVRLSEWIAEWQRGGEPSERAGVWLHCVDGTSVPITVRVFRTKTSDGEQCLVALHDLSDLQSLVSRLDQAEGRLDETQRAARLGWWEWDILNDVVVWSESLHQVLDIPASEFGGTLQSFVQGVHPDDRASVRERLDATLTRNEPYAVNYRVVRKDGSVRHMHGQGRATRDEEGRPLRLYGTCQDVTDRALVLIELRDSERRFRTLFEHSPDAIFVESMAGLVLDVNPAACELHGMSRDELIGLHVIDLVPPRCHDNLLRDFPKLASGELRQLESWSSHPVRKEVPVSLHVSKTEYGSQPALLFHVRDISERKLAEEKAREAEAQLAHVGRLSLMGELMAGISHEINQPLFAIVNFANACEKTLLDGKLARADRLLEWTHKIAEQATRAGEIIRRMRDFSRKSTPHRSTVDVNDMVMEATELIASETRTQHIDLHCEFQPEHLLVLADRIQIQQTLINLLRNAYRAMAANEVADRQVVIKAKLREDRVLQVSVRDNGHGFQGVDCEQIFKPFFTTKPEGLGLGLTISRSIIESHGGKLWAVQNSDRGATFLFTLPLGHD